MKRFNFLQMNYTDMINKQEIKIKTERGTFMKKVLILTLLFIGFVFSQSLQESFNGPVFPPEGWRVYNLEDSTAPKDKSVWQQDGHGPRTTPGCAFCRKTYAGGNNGNPTVPNNDWLVTPRVYPTQSASDLTFYYRGFNKNQTESLEVWVSRGGNHWTDFTNTATGYRVDAFSIRTWDYTLRVVSLASFINQPIYIAFRYCANNTNRHGVFIDDVNTEPAYPPLPRIPLDVGVIEITRPATVIAPIPFTPQATVKNYGANPASFETKCFITNTAGNTTYYTKSVQVTNLAYNTTIDVIFPETTLSAGNYKIKFRTYLPGDQNTANDEMVRDFQVLSPIYRDVGVTNIIKPIGEVTEFSLKPKAEIRNFGTQDENFNVIIEIKNTSNNLVVYGDTVLLALPSLVSTELEFNKNWIPTAILHPYQVTVFTKLSTDLNRSNDTMRTNVIIPQNDAKVSTIYMPLYEIYEPGQSITPSALISNRSFTLNPVTIPSTFTLTRQNTTNTIVYTSSASTQIGFCDDATVTYNPWTADTGNYVVKCKTTLNGDAIRSNDSIVKELFIPYRDVAPIMIEAPYNNFQLQPFIPRAIIRNNGNYHITAPIELTISFNNIAILCDTNYITILQLGFDSLAGMVYFPMWTPPQIGTYTATFRAIFPYDLVPSNNIITKTFEVESPIIDLAILQIKAPKDSITPNTVIFPRVRVKNFGDIPVAGRIYSEISSAGTKLTVYIDSAELSTPLIPGEERIVTFPSCNTINDTGAYEITSQANITGDMNLENNSKTDIFIASRRLRRDIGVYSISEPRGRKPLGMISSQVTVHNYGNTQENFQVQLKIYRKNQLLPVYAPVINVELNKQEQRIVYFPNWASDLGNFVVRCTILFAPDQNISNNFKDDSVTIYQQIETRWIPQSGLPISTSKVKEGGALTYVPNGDYKGIYAFAGGKTSSFYYYNIETNQWSQKRGFDGGISIGKGAALCNDGSNKIYAITGNNTRYFYVYDIAQNLWIPKDNVPNVGTKVKNINGGSGLAYITTTQGDYVYLVKGNKTNDFYKYSVQDENWITNLTQIPNSTTHPTAKVQDGSSITTDGQYLIYLLKAKFNEFFCYDVLNDNWVEKRFITTGGLQGYKKVGKGSAMAYCVEGTAGVPTIYAFKGNNSSEFWKYNIMSNTWFSRSRMDILPGSSGKKVGAGASLVYVADKNTFYALKGNGTNEFYKYIPNPNPGNEEDEVIPSTIQATMVNNTTTLTNTYLKISPKITNNAARIFYSVNTLTPITVKVYNNTGALVKTTENTLNNATGMIALNLTDVSAGIYFIRVESSDNKIIEKIVVQK